MDARHFPRHQLRRHDSSPTNGYVYLEVINPAATQWLPTWTPVAAGTSYSWQTLGASGWSGSTVPSISGDTATFSGAIGAQTIQLNGNPHVGTLTFAPGTGGSYTIAQNTTADNLSLDNGSSTATITNNSGNNTISAPLYLISNTNALPAAGTTLTLSGVVAGGGILTTDRPQARARSISPISTPSAAGSGSKTARSISSTTGSQGTGSITIGDGANTGLAATLNVAGTSAAANGPIPTRSASPAMARTRSASPLESHFSGPVTLANNLTLISNNAGGSTLNLTGNISGTGNITTQVNNNSAAANYIEFTGANSINNAGTITNSGTGTTVPSWSYHRLHHDILTGIPNQSTFINTTVGANVTGIIQNSPTSDLLLGNLGSAYKGGITIQNGILLIDSNANALGAGGPPGISSPWATPAPTRRCNTAARWAAARRKARHSPIRSASAAPARMYQRLRLDPDLLRAVTLNSANLTLAPVNTGGSTIVVSGGVASRHRRQHHRLR